MVRLYTLPPNTFSAKEVVLPMIVMSLKLLQLLKASLPIVDTFLGMMTLVNAEQYENASSSMYLKLSGNSILVNAVQS